MSEAARARLIAEARTWIGTRFRHQAAAKGAGCDCAGLVRGAGHAAGVLDIAPAAWAAVGNYGRQPHPKRMRQALEMFLLPLAGGEIAAEPGDVVWMEWRRELPMHLAILAQDARGRWTMIHALSDFGRVVEHGFTAEWQERVTSWWRYPGLAG